MDSSELSVGVQWWTGFRSVKGRGKRTGGQTVHSRHSVCGNYSVARGFAVIRTASCCENGYRLCSDFGLSASLLKLCGFMSDMRSQQLD